MNRKTVVGLGSVLTLALGSAAAVADTPGQNPSGMRQGSSSSTSTTSSDSSRRESTTITNQRQEGSSAAAAQQQQPGSPSAASTEGMRRGRRIAVNERVTQPAMNNCSYESTIRGSVREYLPASGGEQAARSGSSAQPADPNRAPSQDPAQNQARGQAQASASGAMFVPDLTINSRLRCAEAGTELSSVGALRGPVPMSAQELEMAIESRGRVLSSATGRVCAVAPDVRFDGDRLATEQRLSQQCLQSAPAIGGGPQGDSSANMPSQGGGMMGSGSLPQGQWQDYDQSNGGAQMQMQGGQMQMPSEPAAPQGSQDMQAPSAQDTPMQNQAAPSDTPPAQDMPSQPTPSAQDRAAPAAPSAPPSPQDTPAEPAPSRPAP